LSGRGKCEKLTKINILHVTINYIRAMENLLATGDSGINSFSEMVRNPIRPDEDRSMSKFEEDGDMSDASFTTATKVPKVSSKGQGIRRSAKKSGGGGSKKSALQTKCLVNEHFVSSAPPKLLQQQSGYTFPMIQPNANYVSTSPNSMSVSCSSSLLSYSSPKDAASDSGVSTLSSSSSSSSPPCFEEARQHHQMTSTPTSSIKLEMLDPLLGGTGGGGFGCDGGARSGGIGMNGCSRWSFVRSC
jgi:hypothetical protein